MDLVTLLLGIIFAGTLVATGYGFGATFGFDDDIAVGEDLRPGDDGWPDYIGELEHATIRPLGADPGHCEMCLGYAVSTGRQLELTT